MSEHHCAVVAVLGAPNAGKSTLVNALVGAKVAAVTQKVQTTRALVRGIAMRGDVQLVLIDTPGVFAPKRRLDRAMVAAAWSALEGADAIVHVVDAAAHVSGAKKGADALAVEDATAIAAKLKQMEIASILVLNKVDAVARPALLELTARLVGEGLYTDVTMASMTLQKSWRSGRRRGRGFSPRIRPWTRQRAYSPRRSRARKPCCACMMNCPTT